MLTLSVLSLLLSIVYVAGKGLMGYIHVHTHVRLQYHCRRTWAIAQTLLSVCANFSGNCAETDARADVKH